MLSLPWQKRLIYLSVLTLSSALSLLNLSSKLANLALVTLTITIFLRPLSTLFPQIQILKWLMALRRLIGNSSAIFALAHVFTVIKIYAGLGMLDLWGGLAIVIMIILFLTSNDFSLRLLKRNWKTLHLLIHPLYIIVLLHRGFKNGTLGLIQAAIVLIVLYTVRYLASLKPHAIIGRS